MAITVGTKIHFFNDIKESVCVEVFWNNYGHPFYYFQNECFNDLFWMTEKDIQRNSGFTGDVSSTGRIPNCIQEM